MADEHCANCKFYSDNAAQVKTYGSTLPGICRIAPPIITDNNTAPKASFPPCRPDTWCGKWTSK